MQAAVGNNNSDSHVTLLYTSDSDCILKFLAILRV